MKVGGRNAAAVATSIKDFNHLRQVQRELSEPSARDRAIRRAQRRRMDVRKPGFTQLLKPGGPDGSDDTPGPTYIFGYNPQTDKWTTNKGEKTLGNRAAPEWGERVLDLGQMVLAQPAGDPFAAVEDITKPEIEVEIEVTIGFSGRRI